MLCSKFSILRPDKGFVIVDESPVGSGIFGEPKESPGIILAAYGEGEREKALAHLTSLLDEEDADRAEEAEDERLALEEAQAAAGEPETGLSTKVAGTPTYFDRPDDAEVR